MGRKLYLGVFFVSTVGDSLMGNTVLNQEEISIGLSITHKISRSEDKSFFSIYDDGKSGAEDDVIDVAFGTKEYSTSVANGGTLVSIEKNTRGIVNKQYGGGARGFVLGFSRASRRNLLSHLYRLDRTTLDEKDVLFLTLTYDGDTDKNKWIQGKEYKRHLKNIQQAISRKYGGFGVWKFELQKRLVGHFHLIWYKTKYISHHWLSNRWNEITGGSKEHLIAGTQVKRAESWKGVQLYGSKTMGYVAKDDTTKAQREHLKTIKVGRSWGIWNKQEFDTHINMIELDLTEDDYNILMRIYKRLQHSWKRKAEDYKGWKSFSRWFQSWKRLDNISIDMYVENEDFYKLMDWIKGCKKVKQRVLGNKKLERFRWENGFGIYADRFRERSVLV